MIEQERAEAIQKRQAEIEQVKAEMGAKVRSEQRRN